MQYLNSPCLGCTRVKHPDDCENKQCPSWRSWFLHSWEQLRTRFARGKDPALLADPCKTCQFPRQTCKTPCPKRLGWETIWGGNV
jgi:hypothetical protein